MSGDYTRFTFDPLKRYSGVLMQQGRVQLDADWNEEIDILKRRVTTLSLDAIGPAGVPQLTLPNSFLIGLIVGPPPDLSIEPGRLYVDGLLAEYFSTETWTYLAQPHLPDPPALPMGDSVVYLDVWEREVTYIEDDELLDVALGGVDTTTRTQTVWQLRAEARDNAACGMPVGAPPSAGRLSSEAIAPPPPDDPCILPPLVGYRGLENRLYRIEIHDGGALGTARFKWSRDNGSIVSAVSEVAVAGTQTTLTVNRIGRDQVLRFRIDDWVTVTDDVRELMEEPGEMARIINIDETNRQIVLDRALPTGAGRPFGATLTEIAERHTRIQRWDQTPATNVLDTDGLIATAAGPIGLEDGIQISFDMDPLGGSFRNGDYWAFWARTATASIDELDHAPPRAIVHHYLQLAAITGLGGAGPTVTNCRPPEAGECCCTIVVSVGQSIQGAIDSLPPEGGCVCLKPGVHEIREEIVIRRGRVLLTGESRGVVVRRVTPGVVLVIGGEGGAVEGVEVETIDFEGVGAAGLLSALNAMPSLVAIGRARDITINNCGVAGLGEVSVVGILVVRSDLVEINRCVIRAVTIGIRAFGLCESLRLEANRIELGGANLPILGLIGIVISNVPAACRIEGNEILGPLIGISVNDNPLVGDPSSAANGSMIRSNVVLCGTPPAGVTATDRLHGIDCAADHCLIADNQVSYPSDIHTGIRVTGSSNKVTNNSLIFLGKQAQLAGAFGIVIGDDPEVVAPVLTHAVLVGGNTLMGPQHGIGVIEASSVLIEHNIIDSDAAPVGFGVLLVRTSNVTAQGNRIRNAGAAMIGFGGRNNRVLANDIAEGGLGIALGQEIGPVVSQNRLTNLANAGAIGLIMFGRCDFIENRLTNCGHADRQAIGIGATFVVGELHIEANEIMDTGRRADSPVDAPTAFGIFGDLILEARIESNLVTYSDALSRDPNREDRALLMRGLLEMTVSFGAGQSTFGFPIQIVDNKFIGTGRSALVQLTQLALSPQIHRRFERVIFSQNYCSHVSVPANDTLATVVLVGRSAIVMGNHVKATTPGFFSVDFSNMPGPYIGNVTRGSTLHHADFPVPVGSFNMLT